MPKQDSSDHLDTFFQYAQWIVLIVVGILIAFAFLVVIRLTQQPKPNVLLITIDTLRSDRLGCYGRSPTPSPTIDWIAGQSYVFDRCYASSSWTMPSVMSIHTGQYTFTHGVEWVDRILPENIPTLAEILKEHDYNTGAVESSLFLQGRFGFGRGFDQYTEKPIHNHRDISSPMLTDKASSWLCWGGFSKINRFFIGSIIWILTMIT